VTQGSASDSDEDPEVAGASRNKRKLRKPKKKQVILSEDSNVENDSNNQDDNSEEEEEVASSDSDIVRKKKPKRKKQQSVSSSESEEETGPRKRRRIRTQSDSEGKRFIYTNELGHLTSQLWRGGVTCGISCGQGKILNVTRSTFQSNSGSLRWRSVFRLSLEPKRMCLES
jgi:hypothetical protein